jgi:RNA binding exosome subunit
MPVKKALSSLFPFSVTKLLDQKKVTGLEKQDINVLTVKLTKDSNINAFLVHLQEQLSDTDKKMVLQQKHSRLDADLAFYLRLGKSQLLKEKYKIVEGGNCFHIRILLACYPKSRIQGLKLIDEILTKPI